MVLLSSMQLDERMARQEAMLAEVQPERMAEKRPLRTVKAAGPPKPQSQFFLQRFGHLVARLKLQHRMTQSFA